MKTKSTIVLSALCAVLCAGDLVTKSGKTYKDYDVDRATPSGLSIFHEAGTATVPYADLPDDLRKKYAQQEKEAPAKLKAVQEKAAADKKRQQAEQKKNPTFTQAQKKLLESHQIRLGSAEVRQIMNKYKGVVCCPEYISGPAGTMPIRFKGYENKTSADVFITSIDLNAVTNGQCLGDYDDGIKVITCWEIGIQQFENGRLRKFTIDKVNALEYIQQQNSNRK